MPLWRSKKPTKPEPDTTTADRRRNMTTEEMEQAMDAAKRQALQSDLRALATRLRAEAPDRSPDFNAGIDWAVLWLENTATTITKQ